MTDQLHFERPPVHMVTLALMFGTLPKLQTLDLAQLRVDWRESYPILRESTPMPAWQASEQDAVEFVRSGLSWPMALCSFATEAGDKEVRFQQDRFILRWNLCDGENVYPGYSRLKAELLAKFDQFSKLSQSVSGVLPEVKRADVTYTNKLPGMSAHQAMAGVLTGWRSDSAFPFRVPDYCGFRVSYDESELDPRVSVLIGVDSAVTEPSDGEFIEGSSLIIDAESQVESEDDFADRMDKAHDVVAGAFLEVTSEGMRSQWGEIK
ncbi:TIGR04255 family protein [Streptomyces sp. NPDC093064]|uniref:TIGR04255 family protein n=1 Tax=Streptomyces sp. NPDC093064 TaxID=3366020 RepID=UPI0037FB96B1